MTKRQRAVLLITLPVVALLVVGASLWVGSIRLAPPPTVSPNADRLAINLNRAQGRPVQALYRVEGLAAQNGWTPELHQLAGDLWAEIGDPARALPHWAAAAEAENPLLLRTLASAYMDTAQWPQALDTLDQLLTIDPEDSWANYFAGLLRAPTNPARAQDHLRLAAFDPIFGETARTVRVALFEVGTESPLADPSLAARVGIALAERELWPFAELAFARSVDVSIALDGEPSPLALAYAGLAQDRQGKDGGPAIAEAVRLAPDDAQVRFLLALHRREQGDYSGSLDALIQATVLSPESAALYAELGAGYRLAGDLQAAEQWLQAAVNFSGGDPRFQDMLALFYAEEGVNLGTSGVDALSNAVAVLPEDADVRAGYGWALFTAGDVEGGLAAVDEALELEPNNPRALFYRANMLIDTGETAEATDLLQRVVNIGGPFATEAARILEPLGTP